MLKICDGAGDPCDSVCGGAGCGKCGGVSCGEGAVTKSMRAIELANDSETLLVTRKREVETIYNRVSVSLHQETGPQRLQGRSREFVLGV